MSKNLVIGDKTYNGVSTVNFNTDDGNIAVYKDTDEISSGSSYDISTELTEWIRNETGAEILSKDLFATKELQVPFTKGIVVFHVESDIAPTQGAYTMQNLFFFIDDASVTTAITGFGSLVAPNSIEASKGIAQMGTGSAVFNKNTKILKFYQGFGDSNIYFGSDTVIKVGFIPFEFSTGLIPQAE